jgi:hypothetical protein
MFRTSQCPSSGGLYCTVHAPSGVSLLTGCHARYWLFLILMSLICYFSGRVGRWSPNSKICVHKDIQYKLTSQDDDGHDFVYDDMIYDMINLLTAIGLPPGGSRTVHIYTQTIHRTTQIIMILIIIVIIIMMKIYIHTHTLVYTE